jgi:hypothetical protein
MTRVGSMVRFPSACAALGLALATISQAAPAQHARVGQPQVQPAGPPDAAELAQMAAGIDGVFLACESWVLDPTSWSGADGIAPLVELSGLGNHIYPVPTVIDAAQPPVEFRLANHYFRIDATSRSGFYLVVSDRLPICHITGGGGVDLQPVVQEVLASAPFLARWEEIDRAEGRGMISTVYRHRLVPEMEMIVSRKPASGGYSDVVQMIATAQYDLAASLAQAP